MVNRFESLALIIVQKSNNEKNYNKLNNFKLHYKFLRNILNNFNQLGTVKYFKMPTYSINNTKLIYLINFIYF